jgi:putative sterol carrier protein
MTLQELSDNVRTRVANADTLDATAKLVTDLGPVFINAKQQPATVSNDDATADCELHVSVGDLEKMGNGDLNPMMAFMMGKLKVKGDMGVAMKLGQIMG